MKEAAAGWLQKEGKDSLFPQWKRRWFVLDGTKLVYYKSRNCLNPLVAKGFIDLRKVEDVVDVNNKYHEFELYTHVRRWHLRAQTEEDKAFWMNTISAIRTHGKHSIPDNCVARNSELPDACPSPQFPKFVNSPSQPAPSPPSSHCLVLDLQSQQSSTFSSAESHCSSNVQRKGSAEDTHSKSIVAALFKRRKLIRLKVLLDKRHGEGFLAGKYLIGKVRIVVKKPVLIQWKDTVSVSVVGCDSCHFSSGGHVRHCSLPFFKKTILISLTGLKEVSEESEDSFFWTEVKPLPLGDDEKPECQVQHSHTTKKGTCEVVNVGSCKGRFDLSFAVLLPAHLPPTVNIGSSVDFKRGISYKVVATLSEDVEADIFAHKIKTETPFRILNPSSLKIPSCPPKSWSKTRRKDIPLFGMIELEVTLNNRFFEIGQDLWVNVHCKSSSRCTLDGVRVEFIERNTQQTPLQGKLVRKKQQLYSLFSEYLKIEQESTFNDNYFWSRSFFIPVNDTWPSFISPNKVLCIEHEVDVSAVFILPAGAGIDLKLSLDVMVFAGKQEICDNLNSGTYLSQRTALQENCFGDHSDVGDNASGDDYTSSGMKESP